MKTITPIVDPKGDVKRSEIELVEQKQLEYKLESSKVISKQLTLFSYNVKTGVLKVVERVKQGTVDFTKYLQGGVKEVEGRSIVIKEPDCVYFQKLNANNAARAITLVYPQASVLWRGKELNKY